MDFPRVANAQGMTVTAKSANVTVITGSIHKYANEGRNASQFTYDQLCASIRSLSLSLEIDPAQSTLHGFEFGVNVWLPFPVSELLSRLVCFNNTPFTVELDETKEYHYYKAQRFWVKIYDKGKQYGIPGNLMRFEVKIKKMIHVEHTGIKYLEDLTRKDILEQLGAMLLSTFDSMVFTDRSIEALPLTQEERIAYAQGNNPLFWKHASRKQRHKIREQFNRLLSIGTETYFQTARRAIAETWERLLNNDQGNELTDYVEHPINRHPEQINRLSIGLIHSSKESKGERVCKTCGRDISNQHNLSRYCSERLYGTAGKKCRNSASNPRHNLERREKKRYPGPLLFGVDQYLRPPYRELRERSSGSHIREEEQDFLPVTYAREVPIIFQAYTRAIVGVCEKVRAHARSHRYDFSDIITRV
jgi:hypothetical protein